MDTFMHTNGILTKKNYYRFTYYLLGVKLMALSINPILFPNYFSTSVHES